MKNLLEKIQSSLNKVSPIREIFPLAEELEYNEDLLTENVPLSVAKKYMRDSREHWTKKYQEWFGSYEKTLPNGKKVTKHRARIILPLGGSDPIMPLQANDKVVKYLNKLGYEITDYANNKCKNKDGTKEMNIGGILSGQISRMRSLENIFNKQKKGQKLTAEEIGRIKDINLNDLESNILEVTEAMTAFNDDQKKKASKSSKIDTTQKYVVISRHPVDIAGMSGGRSWAGSSCMRVIPQAGHSEDVMPQGPKKPLKFKYSQPAKVKRKIAILDDNGKPVLDSEGNPKYKFVETNEPSTSREFKPQGQGCNVWAVGRDIDYGTLVGYMIDGDEVYNVAYTEEYKVKLVDPKSRLLAKPYFDEKGVPYLIVTTAFYGERPTIAGDSASKFKETFEKWLKNAQGERYGKFTFKQGSSSQDGLYLNSEKAVHYIKDPATNEQNVKEFKDGLTWEKVMSHFKWFANGTYKNAVIGYSNNEFTFYDGEISVMDWKGGRILGGKLGTNYTDENGRTSNGNFHFHKGSIEKVTWLYGTMTGGTIKNSTVHNITIGRIKSMIECDINGNVRLEGGFFDKCKFKNVSLEPPVPEAKIKINDSKIQNLTINNLDANQKILNNCNIERVNGSAKAIFNNCDLLGGTYENATLNSCKITGTFLMIGGTYNAGIIKKGGKITSNSIKSGTFKDVHFKKMSTSGNAKFIRCVIDIGIVNGGKFHDCVFNAGRFISGTFWGGEFHGTFVGGKFVDSTFGEKAKWIGGQWYSEGEPPAKAKLPKEPLHKKKPREINKLHKELDLKSRLEKKTLTGR